MDLEKFIQSKRSFLNNALSPFRDDLSLVAKERLQMWEETRLIQIAEEGELMVQQYRRAEKESHSWTSLSVLEKNIKRAHLRKFFREQRFELMQKQQDALLIEVRKWCDSTLMEEYKQLVLECQKALTDLQTCIERQDTDKIKYLNELMSEHIYLESTLQSRLEDLEQKHSNESKQLEEAWYQVSITKLITLLSKEFTNPNWTEYEKKRGFILESSSLRMLEERVRSYTLELLARMEMVAAGRTGHLSKFLLETKAEDNHDMETYTFPNISITKEDCDMAFASIEEERKPIFLSSSSSLLNNNHMEQIIDTSLFKD